MPETFNPMYSGKLLELCNFCVRLPYHSPYHLRPTKNNFRISNLSPLPPLYNHMEKTDFLYFEVEAPNGINLMMFRDILLRHFLQKSEKNIRCIFE